MYNTIGNLSVDPRIGLTIPLYETGGMIQITGRAVVDWDSEAAARRFVGAERVIEITVDEVVELAAGSLPQSVAEFARYRTSSIQATTRYGQTVPNSKKT